MLPVVSVLASLILPLAPQDQPSASLQSHTDRLPRPIANDNRIPAGRRAGDPLLLRLVVLRAMWRLDADEDPGIPLLAFAEEGGAPQIPGPLIRVPAGTTVDVAIRN